MSGTCAVCGTPFAAPWTYHDPDGCRGRRLLALACLAEALFGWLP